MIQFPSEWVQHFGCNLVTAYPPGGGGRFRYWERVVRAPRFSRIVADTLATDPEFRVHHVGEMQRLVTGEGEYGAWVRIEGLREGSRALRCIGAVFLDDFATVLDCVVLVPSRFAEFERRSLDLVCSQQLGLARRPRTFFYVPPVDWQAIPAGLTANWYPLDFPKNRSNIAVPPAGFFEGDEGATTDAALDALGAGLTVESSVTDTIVSSSGVRGATRRVQGRRPGHAGPSDLVHRELAVFVVAPYVYRMRLETMNAARMLELGDVFRAVAGSFQPLPSVDERRTGRAFVRLANLFDHWIS